MATEHDDLDPRLRRAIAALSDRDPDVDLWPGVARRIAPARPGTLQLRWPMAAAAAAVLVLGSALATSALLGPAVVGTAPPAPVASSGSGTEGLPALPAGYQDATVTLTTAIDQLEEVFAEAAPNLDIETRRAITEALVSLDGAIEDARERTGAAPGDLEAARYLTHAMQRKLRVLQTVTSLTSAT